MFFRRRRSFVRVGIGIFMAVIGGVFTVLHGSYRPVVLLAAGLLEIVLGFPREESAPPKGDERLHNLRGEAATLTVYFEWVTVHHQGQELLRVPVGEIADCTAYPGLINLQPRQGSAYAFRLPPEKQALAEKVCKTIRELSGVAGA